MRRLLLISLILVNLFACTNKKAPSIKKTWIGSHLEYLKIEDSTAFFDRGIGLENRYTRYIYDNKKISLIDENWHNQSSPDTDCFEVRKLTEDSLVLAPINYKYNGNTLYFIDEAKSVDPNFKFEKLYYYRVSTFLISTPTKMEIDSNGAIFSEILTDTSDVIYSGQLKSADLKRLDSILMHSCLDNWPEKFHDAADASIHKFIFHYNNKKRESTGCLIPAYGWQLTGFLVYISKTYKLEHFKGNHLFEEDSTFPFRVPRPKQLIKELRVTPPKFR